jgi:hypothetical protein
VKGGACQVRACGGAADATLNLVVKNPGDRAARVERVSVVYLATGRELRTDRFGPSFFDGKDGARERKIRDGVSVEWNGICLDRIPPDADRARLDLEFSVREGLSRRSSTERLDLELRPAPAPVVLRVPFDGYWLVTQGHCCGSNHRVGGFGGDYAWDFVRLGATGRIVKESYETTRRNEDTHSFGSPVLAPADGTVVRVVGDVPDNQGLKDYPAHELLEELERPEWIFGNFVVIDTGRGAYVLLGHLLQGSISPKPGDRVRAGDPIARCGNSGSTIWPHLHVQVMDRADPTDTGIHGLPARLANYREITSWGDATHKDIVARVGAEGDPPEGGIVVAAGQEEAKP